MFLETVKVVLIKNRGVFPVKKYLRILAEEEESFDLRPKECVVKACKRGTIVLLNDECCIDEKHSDFLSMLSELSGDAALLCYIFDGDFWGYVLCDNGVFEDCFCPIPDYFGEIDKEKEEYCKGNAGILANLFDVPVEKVNHYLCRWTDDLLCEKAYPTDKYRYEARQMADFIDALDFPFPFEDLFTEEEIENEFINEEEKEENTGEHENEYGDSEGDIENIGNRFANNDEKIEGKFTNEEDTALVNIKMPSNINSSERFHFQVNLGGMLDILSNHLYKSPDVFIRELLQNGVDAITMRQKKQPGWNGGGITISVVKGRKLEFKDNGSGLNEEEIHRFLAVIGQSSKTQLVNGQIPEDYIGRFGIGLLSCFMVSDSIVVHTKPADGSQAHVWTGLPDGTYTLEPLEISSDEDFESGTTVILKSKPGAEHYFQPDKVVELVRYYGLALPVPIYLAGSSEKLNNVPKDFSGIGRSQLLAFGEWLFDEEFLDAIPIQTQHLSGVAYILSYRTDSSLKGGHRIYLKQMLLTEDGNTLLPTWAFFLRCFLNTRNLRPTASREDFYEDEELALARGEFESEVRRYLEKLADEEPEHLQRIVSVHAQAIKSMAVWDDNLFRLFIDYLSFETSEGTLTGAMLKRADEAAWVGSVPRFKQLKPLFMAQGKLLICTGYTFDEELIYKFTNMFSLPFAPLQEESMDLVLEELEPFERKQIEFFENIANASIKEFDCRVDIRRFLPMDLPVLYSMSDEVQFLRQLQSAKDMSSNIFSDALTSLIASVEERPVATLYLNINSHLIQQLSGLQEEALIESISRVLYVQALLAGGHPLRGGELKVMNKELLNLIERSSRHSED